MQTIETECKLLAAHDILPSDVVAYATNIMTAQLHPATPIGNNAASALADYDKIIASISPTSFDGYYLTQYMMAATQLAADLIHIESIHDEERKNVRRENDNEIANITDSEKGIGKLRAAVKFLMVGGFIYAFAHFATGMDFSQADNERVNYFSLAATFAFILISMEVSSFFKRRRLRKLTNRYADSVQRVEERHAARRVERIVYAITVVEEARVRLSGNAVERPHSFTELLKMVNGGPPENIIRT